MLVGMCRDKGAAGCCANTLLEMLKTGLAQCIANQSRGANPVPGMALGRERGSAEPSRVSKGQKSGLLCSACGEHPL